MQRIETTLCATNSSKELKRMDKEITALEQKRKKLVDMRLDDIIDKDTYENKYADLTASLAKRSEEKLNIKNAASRELDIKQRIGVFRKVLVENEIITEFDRVVFESIIEKVVVGGIDNEGNKDPAMLTFIYRTGFTNSLKGNEYKGARKNAKDKPSEGKLYSPSTNEVEKFHFSYSYPTCGGNSVAYVVIYACTSCLMRAWDMSSGFFIIAIIISSAVTS